MGQRDSYLLGVCPRVELVVKGYKGLSDVVIYVQQNSTLAAGSEMSWRVRLQATGESWEAVVVIQSFPSARTISSD